jgi:4-methylaminobutanoate oxidase (formaldehyde-forming)
MGWERPNWFASEGMEPLDRYSFTRPNWFAAVGEEHRACRERVALFDASSFAKFMLIGGDAEATLSWICANDVSRPPGKIIYTQMLNERGGIECDLTVTRLATDAYYIVTGTGFVTHDFTWIKRHIADNADAHLLDVTSAFATLSLMGPRAREVLQQVTADDVSDKAFPFATMKELHIGGAPVRALRLTYVGELGWELHIPSEYAVTVYDLLMQAGQAFAMVNAGYRAIESLRLEKGYRAWGADIGPDYTPIEAGLAWTLKLKNQTPFQGREALVAQQRGGVAKRLACFTVDDADAVLLGRETIYRDGERVGWLSSAGWGYTVRKHIGYGYVRHDDGVDSEFLRSGRYELEVAGERVPCAIHLAPLYDPRMERVKA